MVSKQTAVTAGGEEAVVHPWEPGGEKEKRRRAISRGAYGSCAAAVFVCLGYKKASNIIARAKRAKNPPKYLITPIGSKRGRTKQFACRTSER